MEQDSHWQGGRSRSFCLRKQPDLQQSGKSPAAGSRCELGSKRDELGEEMRFGHGDVLLPRKGIFKSSGQGELLGRSELGAWDGSCVLDVDH